MKIYTYSKAREKLSTLLDEAREEGEVQIKRRDGQMFIVKPVPEPDASPFDVPGIQTDKISIEELNAAVRESRERS